MRVASATLVTSACRAEPFVEKLSMATRGVSPTSTAKDRAEANAISAMAGASGSTTKAQSEKISVRAGRASDPSNTIKKNDDTSAVSGAGPMT